jgi:hypothetical protein
LSGYFMTTIRFWYDHNRIKRLKAAKKSFRRQPGAQIPSV